MSASLIFCSKFDLSESYLIFKTNPLVSILFTFETNLSYTVFLTTLLFTTFLAYLNQQEQSLIFPASILCISAFEPAKSGFTANLHVSSPAAFLKYFFVA